MTKKKTSNVIIFCILCLLVVAFLTPIFFVLINSFKGKMFISNKTVSTYKSRLMEKLECKSLMDLYTFAQRNKIG